MEAKNVNKKAGFILLLLILSISVIGQKTGKELWILYDSADSLSLKKEDMFYFAKSRGNLIATFELKKECRSVFVLKELPRNINMVNREQLTKIIQKIPNYKKDKKGDIVLMINHWYDKVYKKTYIVEKTQNVYNIYKVSFIYVYDVK